MLSSYHRNALLSRGRDGVLTSVVGVNWRVTLRRDLRTRSVLFVFCFHPLPTLSM